MSDPMYRWFVFYRGSILLERTTSGLYTVPFSEEPPVDSEEQAISVTMPDSSMARALLLDTPLSVANCEYIPLRDSYQLLDYTLYRQAGKAEELLHWHRQTRFCGCCGAPMQFHTEISKRCTKCGVEQWPQLSPAIIVLISHGEDILLVQSLDFKRNYYGLVAGFVETGESLEECVVREVREETGLEIQNLRYFKSQPWPYPMGLMLGFFAEYKSGNLKLQTSELKCGGWFHKDKLPPIPGEVSLARQLIDAWLEAE